MRSAIPLPSTGEVFLDARGGGRALRVSWHGEAGIVVLSLWRGQVCAGTFRLDVDEVPALVDLLRESLDRAYDEVRHAFPDSLTRNLTRDRDLDRDHDHEGHGDVEAG